MNVSRKRLLMIVLVAGLTILAGCETGGQKSSADAGGELSEDMGTNASETELGVSYWAEIQTTERNQQHLVQQRPPFLMEDSLERQNLIRRYQYLNDANNRHHVYFIDEGQVVMHRVALGKVSSVNSKLTNDRQIVVSQRCLQTTYREDEAGCFHTVESPQMDGSYGTNGAAIFFFTTDGHYVEYNGKYVVSEEPLNINSEVVLTEQVDSDGNSVDSDDTNSTNSTE